MEIAASYFSLRQEGNPDGNYAARKAEAFTSETAGNSARVRCESNGNGKDSRIEQDLHSSFQLRAGNARAAFANVVEVRSSCRRLNGCLNRRQVELTLGSDPGPRQAPCHR